MKFTKGILAPMITPFTKEGALDREALHRNVSKLTETRLAGLFILGSNGEAAFLTDDEQLEVVRITRAALGADKLLMVGASKQSAYAAVSFLRDAASYGADCFSVLTPSFFASAMDDDALIRFYTDIADASPAPIFIYNCPKYAASVAASPEAVRVLSRHANIAGIKESSSRAIEYADLQSEDFSVISGSVNSVLSLLKKGSRGGVLSMSNYLPDETAALVELWDAGKTEDAEALSAELIRLNRLVSGRCGVAGIKAACDLMGYRGGSVRSPLRDCTTAERELIREALLSHGCGKAVRQ